MELILILLVVVVAAAIIMRLNREQVAKDAVVPMVEPSPTAENKPVPTLVEEVKETLDVNKDGQVNTADVKEAVKRTKARVKKVADQNADGNVDAKDIKTAVKKVRAKTSKKA
jgi:hypothetical protein